MIARCLQVLSVVIATILPHSVALAETTSEQEVVNYDYRVVSKIRFDRKILLRVWRFMTAGCTSVRACTVAR